MPSVTGILLAAGRGTRFGGQKLLEPLPDGRPLVLAAAQALIAAVPDALAVIRPGENELAGLLTASGMRVVACQEAEQGMGHSLAAGVAAAAQADGWLIALGDMPYIQPSTYGQVMQALRSAAPLAAPVYQGRRGHPVGFAAPFGPQLRALRGDSGARELVKQHAADLVTVEVGDPGILVDIDFRQQLAEAN